MNKTPRHLTGRSFLHLLPLDLAAGVGGFVGGAGEAGDHAAADGASEDLVVFGGRVGTGGGA